MRRRGRCRSSTTAGPGAATIWLHMGSFAPKRVRDGRRGLSAGAAVSPGGQRELAARRHRHGVRRRDRHRLQPRGRRRRQQAVPRRPRRPARVRRVHQRLPEGLQPLSVAEVSDRRKLRHDPLRGSRAGAAEPPRHRAERHHPRLVAAHLPDDRAVAGERRRLRLAHRDLHGDGVVSQEAAGGSVRRL